MNEIKVLEDTVKEKDNDISIMRKAWELEHKDYIEALDKISELREKLANKDKEIAELKKTFKQLDK